MANFLKLPWRVHTPNMLKESLGNPGMSAMNIPFQVFGDLLYQVAERAAEINDPVMNALMMRLTLYEAADPEKPGFDKKLFEETLEKAGMGGLKFVEQNGRT